MNMSPHYEGNEDYENYDNDENFTPIDTNISKVVRNTARYIASQIRRPEDFYDLTWSCILLSIFILIFLIFIYKHLNKALNPKNYLVLQHIFVCYLHIVCIVIYNLGLSPDICYLINVLYYFLDLVIPFHTLCLSNIMFLNIFFFRNNEQLYSKKEILLFSNITLMVMEFLELALSTAFNIMSVIDAKAVMRLTSVLLVMSIPLGILVLLTSALLMKSSDIPKSQCLLFLIHISIFVLSDFILLFYNITIKNIFIIIHPVLLCLRIAIEMIWYIVYNKYFCKSLYLMK